MADSAVAITSGSGTSIDTRTESTNGNHRQVIVIGDPSSNTAVAPVDVLAGLSVNITNSSLPVAAHAVTNAGTFVVQENGAALTALQLIDDTIATTAAAIPAKGVAISGTDGTNARVLKTDASGELQVDVLSIAAGTNNIGDVDVLTLPALVAGTANIGDVDVLTVNGVAPAFGTGARGATVQRVTIATDDSVPVTGTFYQATQPVSIATNTPLGTVAHDAVDSGAPIKMGGRAVNAEIAAVANNDRSDFITDLVGKLIVAPYTNPENIVSGTTAAMTGTTSTSLIAAPAAGLRNYLTTIIVSNSHATVGTNLLVQDGSGGTTLLVIPAAAVYGGAVINLPVPLRQPTTATALFVQNETTGAAVKASAVGYKGA